MREEIADVDREIVGLVARRLHLAAQVGVEKHLLQKPVRDEEAEDLVHTRFLSECAARDIRATFAEGLAGLLIDESIRRQEAVRTPASRHQRILVVGGAGQMGRWLCRYFRSRGFEVVVNDPAGPLEGFPFEPDLRRAVHEADVVAVSVPMSVSADVLRTIAEMKPKALVFDIASLKAPVEDPLRSMGRAGLRVTSVHPMFGPNLWPLSSGNIIFSDCGNAVAVLEAKEL
ncbi:MAG TPA: prephenate dehydrogenase/arogenate dehydrogenase family protein, partial [Thermoplasmata archaeon]|nr:prephenate dehydrogenase/arogenate dehydrogenase family protein [Thermoplasmata archaeon]